MPSLLPRSAWLKRRRRIARLHSAWGFRVQLAASDVEVRSARKSLFKLQHDKQEADLNLQSILHGPIGEESTNGVEEECTMEVLEREFDVAAADKCRLEREESELRGPCIPLKTDQSQQQGSDLLQIREQVG